MIWVISNPRPSAVRRVDMPNSNVSMTWIWHAENSTLVLLFPGLYPHWGTSGSLLVLPSNSTLAEPWTENFWLWGPGSVQGSPFITSDLGRHSLVWLITLGSKIQTLKSISTCEAQNPGHWSTPRSWLQCGTSIRSPTRVSFLAGLFDAHLINVRFKIIINDFKSLGLNPEVAVPALHCACTVCPELPRVYEGFATAGFASPEPEKYMPELCPMCLDGCLVDGFLRWWVWWNDHCW